MKAILAAVAALALLAAGQKTLTGTLNIYFIDVEGGQATLIVTPAGQSLLVDAGYPGREGRDPDRIMAAARDAGLTRIDYLLVTHLHEDHNGGAAELSRRIPIGTFVDYGSPVENATEVVFAFAHYSEARTRSRHLVPKSGDRLPLGDVIVDVISANGAVLSSPLDGAGQRNAACADFERPPESRGENPRSIGIRLRFGAFRFLDVGDLVAAKMAELVCPANLIGEVDVYLLTHHANSDVTLPAVFEATRPRVAIANNGPWKGATPQTMTALHELRNPTDVWQLHRTINYGAENFPDAFIANLGFEAADGASWIKLSASESGAFSITNGRTGWTKQYLAR
jgi:beta-lactamase superfamily II metal-dependent hydrolase